MDELGTSFAEKATLNPWNSGVEELASTTRRVYGEFHPFAKLIQHELMDAQEKLAAFDASHRV